jgi:hypothetical protein
LFTILRTAQESFTSVIYVETSTLHSEGLLNLGLCAVLRAFEQEGIFFVPNLLYHGASIFPVLSEGPPHLVAFVARVAQWLERRRKDLVIFSN